MSDATAQTVRVVTACVGCPFCQDNMVCGAVGEDVQLNLSDAEYWGDVPPPDSCPLRAAPVLVTLRADGGGQ
jgi:hypothetical protein